MQFAKRQRLLYGGWRLLLAGIPVGLLLGFAGPFGTFPTFPTATRYAFWTGLSVAGLATALAANASIPIGKLSNGLLRVSAVALLSAIPMTFVVAWTMTLIQPDRTYSPQQLFGLFWGVAAVQLLIVYASIMAIPRFGKEGPGVPEETASRQVPISYPAALLSKLPGGIGSEILALETEDHYLRVHTSNGSALILMRMADAVALLHPKLGAQVHRRWWVAEAAVAEMRIEGQKVHLRLSNDRLVPIGRTFAPGARTRFGSRRKSAISR